MINEKNLKCGESKDRTFFELVFFLGLGNKVTQSKASTSEKMSRNTEKMGSYGFMIEL